MLDIKNLVQSLLILEPNTAQPNKSDNVKVGTTIRLDGEVREFLEQYTQALGVSLQEIISMLLKAVMLQSKNTLPITFKLTQIVENFIEIFNAHNISYLDINKILETDKFPPSSFLKPELLADQLNDTILQKMGDIFYLNKDWLKGTDEKNVHNIFSNANDITNLVNLLTSLESDPNIDEVSMILCCSSSKEFSYDPLAKAKNENVVADQLTEICPVLEIVRKINGIQVICYQLLDKKPWDYQKYRFYLKSLTRFFHRCGKSIRLGTLAPEYFTKFSLGHCLPAKAIRKHLCPSTFDILILTKNDEWNPERNEQEYFEVFYSEMGYEKYEKFKPS